MKYIILLSLLFTVVLLSSCEKDYQYYDDTLEAVSFDLPALTNGADSLSYSFAFFPGVNEDTIRIPVHLWGYTTNTDRQVNVKVLAENTTAKEGEDYTVLPCVIRGTRTSDDLNLVVRRTDKMKRGFYQVCLKIEDSPDLIAGPENEGTLRVILTAMLVRPLDWPYQLGDWSQVKHQFVIDVTGKGTNFGTISTMVRWTAFMQQLYEALNKYNGEHPNDKLKDENGNLVVFP